MIGGHIIIFSRTFLKIPLLYPASQLHSQQFLYKKYNVTQMSKLAQKFLSKKEYLIKKQKEIPQKNPQALVTTIFSQKNDHSNSIRIKRLNKIFMEKITEILLTSHYAFELLNKGFEITQIRVQPNLSEVHVCWFCSKVSNEEEFYKLLVEISNYLRYDLSSQKILGRIPPILFVKDGSYYNSIEVDKRLESADFGPDHIPVHSSANDDEQSLLPTVGKELSDEVWNAVDCLSGSVTSSEDVKGDYILSMRQNIFGVDREKIMKNVIRKSKESLGLHRFNDEEPRPSSISCQSEIENPKEFPLPIHSRTREIKKWVGQFKKARKNVSIKKKKYCEKIEFMTLLNEEMEDSEVEINLECSNDDWEDYDGNLYPHTKS